MYGGIGLLIEEEIKKSVSISRVKAVLVLVVKYQIL